MARPRQPSTVRGKARTPSLGPTKARSSSRNDRLSAKGADSEPANTSTSVRTGRVGKSSPAKRSASLVKRIPLPAKTRKPPADPATLLRLARWKSLAKRDPKAKGQASAEKPSPASDYSRLDLEQLEHDVHVASANLDDNGPGLRDAWNLMLQNVFLDGYGSRWSNDNDPAKAARKVLRSLKTEVKLHIGPHFQEAWNGKVKARELSRYLIPQCRRGEGEEESEAGIEGEKFHEEEEVEEIVRHPSVDSRGQRPIKATTSANGPKGPRRPSKAGSSKADSGYGSRPNSEKGIVKDPKSPVKPPQTKGQRPARHHHPHNMGPQSSLPNDRGTTVSITNPATFGDSERINKFYETLPGPEVWHRRMPPFFPFGETPEMERLMSMQIDEDLKRGADADHRARDRNKGTVDFVVGKVAGAGQAVMNLLSPVRGAALPRRYPPAWNLPAVTDADIESFVARLATAARKDEEKGKLKMKWSYNGLLA